MPYVVLTPTQFEAIEQACEKSDQIKKFTATSPNTGVIETHDVTVDYTYDPLRQILNYNIGAKHSLAAKVAGDNVIERHITALLHSMDYTTTAVAVEPNATVVPEPSVKSTTDPVPQTNPPSPSFQIKKPIPTS